MGSTCKKHDWLVKKIYDHPELISIKQDDVLSKTEEVALLYKGHLLTIPDIKFETQFDEHYIEVKSDNSEFLFRKGMSQLEKICMWHEGRGKTLTVAPKIVMPCGSKYGLWIDMLHELKFYEPGDLFQSPKYF